MEAIDSVVHLYLLWAGALHDNVERFSSKTTDDSNGALNKPQSNAKVESYFAECQRQVFAAFWALQV